VRVRLLVEHVQGVEYVVDTDDAAFLAAFAEAFGQDDEAEPLDESDVQDLVNEEDQESSVALLNRIATREGITSGEFVRVTQAKAL
jgi:hypothetical protein